MLGAAPMATHSHGTSSGSSDTDALQPRVTFAPTLAQGSLSARTITLAETLDRWCADVNAREGVGCAFEGVIAGKRWRTERYDMCVAQNGALLRTDGHDPLTLFEVAP